MKLLSILLILISASLSFKHGWDAFRPANAEQARMMADLGISKSLMPYFGVLSLVVGLLLLFPQTFVLSNVLNAMTIVTIMALSIHAGIYKMALIEIPFLALPMVMLWLKYPFKF